MHKNERGMFCSTACVIAHEGFRKWAFLRKTSACNKTCVNAIFFPVLSALLLLVDNTDFDSFDVHDQLFPGHLVIPGAFLAVQQLLCIPHFLL